jgi:ureidoglycolate hydrolase
MDIKKADKVNFKTYGSFVSIPEAEPTSQSRTYKFWSDIADYKISGETEIGICTVYKQTDNDITGFERHLQTPELLIPIDTSFVLPVLLEGRDKSEAEFFRVDVGEAVVINNGVWHGACLPFNKDMSSYYVIFKKSTPFEDIEKK